MPSDKLSKKARAQKILGYDRGDLSYKDALNRIDSVMSRQSRHWTPELAEEQSSLAQELQEKKIDPRTVFDDYEAYNAKMYLNLLKDEEGESNLETFIESQLPYSPEAEEIDDKAAKVNRKSRNKMLKKMFKPENVYIEEEENGE